MFKRLMKCAALALCFASVAPTHAVNRLVTGYGWRAGAYPPFGTYWAGSAVSGSNLYVIGGSSHWDKIGIYNSLTNKWTNPTVGWMGFLLRSATIADKIYIFATCIEICSPPTTSRLWIYNLTSKTLSRIARTPPNLNWTSQPAVYNGKIYFFGGYIGYMGGPVKTTWEFNPATLAFARKASLPTAGYAASTAVLNGKIYVIGGNYRYNKIEIYNPANNTWAPSLSFFSLSMWGWDAAAPLGAKIAIAGSSSGRTFLFDPATKSLSAQQTMPRIHGSYVASAGLGGRLYVAGGQSQTNLLDSFMPQPGAIGTQEAPLSEAEALAAPAVDYPAIEEALLSVMEQVQQEAAARDEVASVMMPEQMAWAQKLAGDWTAAFERHQRK